MGIWQSTAQSAISPISESDLDMPNDTKMTTTTAGKEGAVDKDGADSKEPTQEGASTKDVGESSQDRDHGHSHATSEHDHDHSNGDGCGCGHEHGCNCAIATKNIIKSFLPLLSVSHARSEVLTIKAERKAELDGWSLNEDTWSCVPRTDAPSFATLEAVYAYKFNKPANEAPTVNAYMGVLNTLNHHIKAFGSTFLYAVPSETSKFLDEKVSLLERHQMLMPDRSLHLPYPALWRVDWSHGRHPTEARRHLRPSCHS